MSEVELFLKEANGYRKLDVPRYVVRDLLRDKLSRSEVERIHRLAQEAEVPEIWKAGSVVVDFSRKTAECFQAGLRFADTEPTWDVHVAEMKLRNY